jgi:hypothetical protein
MIQSGYTKLFGSIVASTIWREDDKTRIVWITLLALSDKDGYVAGSIPGLADLARVSIAECEQALEKLQQADKYSRSPEHDGRRLEVVEGGWLILNRAKYRDGGWDQDKIERHREANRRYYQRRRNKKSDRTSDNSDIRLSESDYIGDKKETEKEKRLNPGVSDSGSDSSNLAPRTKRSEADSRFKPFVDIISRYWSDKNSVPLVWDKSEGKNLKLLLAASPHLTVEQFARCLANRADSEGVAHGERPRAWLSDVLRYANGPLDRFGRTTDLHAMEVRP